MVKLSLGGLRKTGRRSGKGKRFGKRKFNGYKKTAATLGSAFTMPTSLYLPMPAQFFASFKLTISTQEAIAAPGQILDFQDCLAPYRLIGGANHFAEYWLNLMRVYSRCVVDKFQVRYEILNIANTPLEVAAAVVNTATAGAIPGGVDGFDQLCAHPESTHDFISVPDGGKPVVDLFLTSDLRKALAQGTERDVCVTSTLAGIINNPPLIGTAASPVAALYIFNRSAVGGAVVLRRTFTFHVKFMDRHAQTQL